MKRTGCLAAALAVSLAATCVAAEDWTVTEPVTVSADATYGRLLVNADLTVAAGVKLTCDTLCIASNATSTATLTLEEGASLTVTGKADRSVLLGAEGGQAHLILKSGSSLTADSIFGAYGYTDVPAKTATPTRSFVTVSNATITLNGTAYSGSTTKTYYGIQLPGGGNWPSGLTQADVVDFWQLDEGAKVHMKRLNKSSKYSAKIVFNGGGLVSNGDAKSDKKGAFIDMGNNAKKSTLHLAATNDCPVFLAVSHNMTELFSFGSSECVVSISGDGDFVKAGTTSMGFAANDNYWAKSNPNIRFQLNGKCQVAEGGLKIEASNILTNGAVTSVCDWEIDKGALLDLNGFNAEVKSFVVQSGGVLANGSQTVSQLTLGIGDADSVCLDAWPERVNVRKVGLGTLKLLASDLPKVTVDGGELRLLGRREIGYPFYKFNAYKTKGDPVANLQLRIAEFKFLDGETDVTQGWTAYYYVNKDTSFYNQPTNMWDGDLSTYFYDQRAQSAEKVTNIHVEVEYRPARKVTGYTWATSSADWTQNSDPVSWEMFGSVDNKNWQSLDLVEDYAPPWNRGVWVGTNFVFSYAATVATLTDVRVAAGAKLSGVGADLTLSSAQFDADSTLALDAGGSMALPSNTTLSKLEVNADSEEAVDLSGFTPASSGTLFVTGTATKCPRQLPLKVGGLGDGFWENWTVLYNGVRQERIPYVANGLLILKGTLGLVFVVE